MGNDEHTRAIRLACIMAAVIQPACHEGAARGAAGALCSGDACDSGAPAGSRDAGDGAGLDAASGGEPATGATSDAGSPAQPDAVDAGGDSPDAPGPEGYLVFSSDVTGTTELWAVPDTGGEAIRLTDGITNAPTDRIERPSFSPIAGRMAFAVTRDAAGEPVGIYHLWTMAPDGSGLRHVTEASTGGAYYGHSWLGDGRHIIYGMDLPCSGDLWRVDERSGEAELVYDEEHIAAEPSGHPTDANRVLVRRQVCGEHGSVRLLELDSGAVSKIEDTLERDPRFAYIRYSLGGDLFAYADPRPGGALYVHDFERERLLLGAGSDERLGVPVFGNDDRTVYARSARGETQDSRWIAVDVATGAARELPVRFDGELAEPGEIANLEGVWMAAPDQPLDRDGDGLGNGIDPSPGWPLRLEADEHTVGLWHFDEASGDVVTDASGNGLDGELQGEVRRVQGRHGGGLELGAAGAYARMPESDAYFGDGGLTIEAWILPAAQDFGYFWDVRSSQSLRYVAGEVRAELWLDGVQVFLAGEAEPDRWHHVALTHDGERARLYIDGRRVKELAQAGSTAPAECPAPAVGSFCLADGGWFQGTVDELRISKGARYTEATIPGF